MWRDTNKQEQTIRQFAIVKKHINHFTVVDLVTWSLDGSEAGVDLVLIQTSLLLLCKSRCSYANQFAFAWEKLKGLYQSKVNTSLACIHGLVTKHTTVKWPIVSFSCTCPVIENVELCHNIIVKAICKIHSAISSCTGSITTLTMFGRNLSPIIGQAHEKMMSIC